MSYCRWSSNNWDCDLYCYEHVDGGFTTHVAGNRVVGDVPKDMDFPPAGTSKDEVAKWAEEAVVSHRAQMAFLETAERKDIGLPHDGETFSDPDLESFLARVTSLRDMGYHVPDFVIESIKDEIASTPEERTE
jgi:hypothetical protein